MAPIKAAWGSDIGMSASESAIVVKLPEAARRQAESRSPCAACPIRHQAVCSVLDDGELLRLNAIRMPANLRPNGILFDEGEPAGHVYNLTEGTMKLYKLLPDGRRQITGFVFPGDFLGLASHTEYVYTAEAVNEANLCRFSRSQLKALFKEIPKLEGRLLAISQDELVQAHNQMLLLGRKSAKERLASFLVMLSERTMATSETPDSIPVPMSRNDIGDYLGLTTETVSRTLTRLKNSGVISIGSDRKINVSDWDALREMADGF